jgi:CMP-N,N'-diacetyllegionaminic acid synthase
MPAARTVALIPARGGSKGLPGKNVRLLAGKPLIQHTIEAALQCPLVDTVTVSTDDAAIRQASEAAGATVLERPAKLATDTASTMDVVRHFLDEYQKKHGDWPETLVLLQPTSPLRTMVHLAEALKQYAGLTQPASLVSVSPAKPISWQGSLEESGLFAFHQSLDLSRNRQAEAQNYILNGAIYVSSPQRFYNGELTASTLSAYVMTREASIDIDTLFDFELAEFILQRQRTLAATGGAS